MPSENKTICKQILNAQVQGVFVSTAIVILNLSYVFCRIEQVSTYMNAVGSQGSHCGEEKDKIGKVQE